MIMPYKSKETFVPIMKEKVKQNRAIIPVVVTITVCPETMVPTAEKNNPAKPTNNNLQVIKKAAILASLV
tara:strand:+ start:802 stop:1011 length:210 start_codon:yes stop_codon:yes gene_type:complete